MLHLALSQPQALTPFGRSARCVWYDTHLGTGTRWRVPVASPRLDGAVRARLPAEASAKAGTLPRRSTVSPVDHSRGRLRSPCTHRHKGRIAAPMDPLAGLGAFPLHQHRTIEERPGRSIAAGRSLQAPRTPMATVLPVDHIRSPRNYLTPRQRRCVLSCFRPILSVVNRAHRCADLRKGSPRWSKHRSA